MINRCENEDKHIPWFVFTTGIGYNDALLDAIPLREWTRKQYYLKNSDQQTLINDIRDLTKNSGNVALRERYTGIFDLCNDEATGARLFDILKKIEEPKSTTDTTLFNALRKVLAFAVSYCRAHGLFSEEIDSAREALKRLNEIHALDPQLAPSYIVKNFDSLCDSVNNGSHCIHEDADDGTLTVDADVLAGDAPYLTRVCIYQLLTILHWLRRLPIDEQDIEALRKHIDVIFNNPMEFYENRECFLQCDNGVWHYGRCAVRPRPAHTLIEQTLVRLCFVQPNQNYTTKKQYPFFARYEIAQ